MLTTFWSKNDGEKGSRNNYFEISPCGKMVIFVTEFVILHKNLPFYEVRKNEFPGSRFPHGGILKYFFLGHFSPSFLGQKFNFSIQIPF